MKRLIFFSVIVLTIFLTSCSSNSFEDDFPEFENKEHVFRKVNYYEVIDSLTKKEGKIYIIFSFKECPYCQAAIPILNEAALDMEIEEVIYFDILKIRNERTKEYLDLVELLQSQVGDLLLDDNGDLKITVPDVYRVNDGKVEKHHIATIKNHEGKFIRDLTDSEKIELKKIYLELFK